MVAGGGLGFAVMSADSAAEITLAYAVIILRAVYVLILDERVLLMPSPVF